MDMRIFLQVQVRVTSTNIDRTRLIRSWLALEGSDLLSRFLSPEMALCWEWLMVTSSPCGTPAGETPFPNNHPFHQLLPPLLPKQKNYSF